VAAACERRKGFIERWGQVELTSVDGWNLADYLWGRFRVASQRLGGNRSFRETERAADRAKGSCRIRDARLGQATAHDIEQA
jgi:hypothetical protein